MMNSYLAVLPRACSVPLCWGFRELQQLHGTPLLQATLSKRRQLQAMWGSTVEAILKAAFELIGLSEDPSPQDFVWSYTMVWSRLLEWPAEEGGEEGHMEEGLLPFIDCCNHVFESPVTRVAGDGGMLLTTVAPLPPATQVCFSYGDKGNEGLLFLYGFALPTNPHDRLLLHVPPSALHDLDALEARLALLQSRGLSLRWLLPDPQRVDAAAAAWQEAVAAAHVLTMPAEEATQAALDEASPESTSNNEDDELIPTACAEGSSTEEALQWLRKLLEARQRELETDLDEISLDELRESSASWEEFRGTEAETSCRSDRNVEEGPIKMGGEAGEGDFKGQARYCEYYRASERRLCSAYLERSSTTSLHTLDSSQ